MIASGVLVLLFWVAVAALAAAQPPVVADQGLPGSGVVPSLEAYA